MTGLDAPLDTSRFVLCPDFDEVSNQIILIPTIVVIEDT